MTKKTMDDGIVAAVDRFARQIFAEGCNPA
jgi:hypothetical protein